MSKMKLPGVLLALLLTGCETTGPEIKFIDTGCDWTRPIYVSKTDIVSDGTARQILAHNETGVKRCGWKPTADKSKKK